MKARVSRAGLLVGVAVVFSAIVAGTAWWQTAGAPRLVQGSPANWRSLLDGDAPRLSGFLPPVRSAEDRVELDEVVALQAQRTAVQESMIDAWSDAVVVDRWVGELMELVRDERLNPMRASRAYALLSVAMYDAVVAVNRLGDPERPTPSQRDDRIHVVPGAAGGDPSAMVAVAGAAERVLAFLFPDRRARFETMADEAARSCLWAGTGTRSEVDAARAVGRHVGERVVSRARADGSQVEWMGTEPSTVDTWHPTAGQRRPLEPLAGTWRTWLLTDGAELRPGPPPLVGSPEFERDAEELKRIRRSLTPKDVETARFWADGGGTVTPAGHWLLIALDVAREAGLGLESITRLVAYVSVAQADAFIACWDAKFTYWSARPVQLIDGFVSAIPTPPFPAYPSGHSTQSRAAATVLAAVFPSRSEELLALASQAGESRIVAGIHWRADHTAGSALGAAVAQRAIDRMRADEQGPD